MIRLLFLCCILLMLCAISIAQDYYYEADVADPNISVTADQSYESVGGSSESYSGDSRGTVDPRYETEVRTSSRGFGDEYLLKPGAFSKDNGQEKKLQEKVTNVTSGTLKTLLVFGLVGICIVGFILNNTR